MSIADRIQSIGGHIKEAYNVVKEKGGELPEELNLSNLANAVDSIAGGSSDYGFVTVETDSGEKQVPIDFENFLELSGKSASRSYITYEGENYDKNTIVAYDTGDTLDWLLPLMFCRDYDNWETEEYAHFDNLKRVRLGKSLKVIPSNFCQETNLEQIDMVAVEVIGSNFLTACYEFNQPITLPETVKRIESGFLNSCVAFNQPITLPEGLVEVERFLNSCSSFNSPIQFPSTLKRFSGLSQAESFNQVLDFPEDIEYLGGLAYMRSYSQTLTIPSGVREIDGGFLNEMPNLVHVVVNTTWVPDNTEYNVLVNFSDSAKSFIEGVTLSGPGADAWREKLTTLSEYQYRYIIGNEKPSPYIEYETDDGVLHKVWTLSSARNYIGSPWENTSSGRSYTSLPVNTTKLRVLEKCRGQNMFVGSSYNKFWLRAISYSESAIETIEGLDNITVAPSNKNGPYFSNCKNLRSIGKLPDWLRLGSGGSTEYLVAGCPVFNQELYIPDDFFEGGLSQWPNVVMNCESFNSPISYRPINGKSCVAVYGCPNFNSSVEIRPGATILEGAVVRDCEAFNQPIIFPWSVVSAANPIYNCPSFTGPLNVGSLPAPADGNSVLTYYKSSSTIPNVPCLTEGITLTGANAQAWKDALPDKMVGPYWRRLIVA